MARDAGANKVYFASAAPPIRYANVYGIDMPATSELIAAGRSTEEVAQAIGADRLFFQDLPDLIDAVQHGNQELSQFDTSCFTGEYVTASVATFWRARNRYVTTAQNRSAWKKTPKYWNYATRCDRLERGYPSDARYNAGRARRHETGCLTMPTFENGPVTIHYEEAGSGFPLLVIPGGGLNATIAGLASHAFNPPSKNSATSIASSHWICETLTAAGLRAS